MKMQKTLLATMIAGLAVGQNVYAQNVYAADAIQSIIGTPANSLNAGQLTNTTVGNATGTTAINGQNVNITRPPQASHESTLSQAQL